MAMETNEVSCESEKQDAGVQVRKRRINALSYKAFLKQNKKVKAKDHNKELNSIDKSSQGYSSNCEDDSSNEVRGISSDAEQAQVDCSTEENLQSPETVDSETLEGDICMKRGKIVLPLKRKRNKVEMVSDASAAVASEETSISQTDVAPLSPTRCPEICGDKKQRVDSDSTQQEILSSCLPTSKEIMDVDLSDSFIAELMAKLLQKQVEEIEGINKRYEEEKARLYHKKRTEAAVIRFLGKMQTNRLKILDKEYAEKLEKLKHERDRRLENLEVLHVAAVNKVRERETSWVEGVKSRLQVELSNKPSSNEFGDSVECLQAVEQHNAHDKKKNVVPNSIRMSEGQNPNKLVNFTLVNGEEGVESSVLQETMPDEVVACSNPFENVAGPLRLNTEGDQLDTIASEETSIAGLNERIASGNSGDNQENSLSLNPCSREQILDGDMFSMLDGHIQLEVSETIGSSDGAEDCLLPVHSSDVQIHDGARPSPKEQVPGEIAKTSSNDGLESVVPVNAPSSKDQIPDGTNTSLPDAEVLLRVPEAASSSICAENFVDCPPSEEQIDAGGLLVMPDEEVPLNVAENIYPSYGLENAISLNPSSKEQIPDGVTSCIPSEEVLLRVPESYPGEIVESCNINGDNDEASATISENVNHNLHLLERSLVNPFSIQTQTIIEDHPVPSNQAPQIVCSETPTSTRMQDGDAAASEIQIALQVVPLLHPVDAAACNQGAAASEPVITGATEPVVSGSGHQLSSENCFTNQFAHSPRGMVENRVELSDQGLSEPVTSSALNPTTDRLGATSMDRSTGVVISGYTNGRVQNTAPVASWLPQHMITDPLQNELERICRSTDEAIRTHEESKLKVKSDCDREIEEAITRIFRKYEIKLKELETEFMLRKQELDANGNKVLMNKLVAMAFRSKWMDMKASSAGMQHEVSYGPIHQQLAHLLPQRTAQRPPVFAGPSGPPAASVQTTATPAAGLPFTFAAASQHTAAPTSQAVPYSSALFSNIPSIPPHISSRVSPINLQVGRGILAPAPHLQPFRPSTSFASTSLPSSVLPSLPSNPCQTSLPLPQHPLLTRLATYCTGVYNRPPRPEASGVAPSLPDPFLSAMDLHKDFVDNRGRENQIHPSSLPSLSDFGSNVPIVQSESTMHNDTRANNAQGEPADIVCLSDDD